MAHIEYPGLPVEYVMEMVHKFYDEYFFRPKQAWRVVWQAIVNRDRAAAVYGGEVVYEAAQPAEQGGAGGDGAEGAGVMWARALSLQG